MVEIIALQEYADRYISLYEGQIRNISIDLANKLINKGIVALHDNENNDDVAVTYYYFPSSQEVYTPDKKTEITWENKDILLNDIKTKKVLFQFVSNNFVSTGKISEIISIRTTSMVVKGIGVFYNDSDNSFDLNQLFAIYPNNPTT